MKTHSKYITAIAIPLLAFAVLSMSFGDAYAHSAEVVGDYKIEIGWEHEPPIQGIDNSIELVITHATEDDKKHAEEMDNMDMAHDEDHEHEGGVSGLEEILQITVTLGEKTHTINMSETEIGGIYLGKFTPPKSGYPTVHLSGTILDTNVDLDMHPEEVESLNTLPPLKQIRHGIVPGEVQCKEGLELFMRVNTDSAICASDNLGQRLMDLGVVDYF